MNIYEKQLQIQTSLKAPKSQYNEFGKYKYRNCEDILEAVKPLCGDAKAVLRLSDEIMQIGERYYVKASAILVDCEKPEDTIIVTASAREEESKKGMDASQVTGASSSYARKYALNGMFDIDDTKDSDTTNHGDDKTEKKSEPKKNNEPIRELTADEIDEIANGKDSYAIELAQAKMMTTSGGKSYDSLKDDQLQFIMQKSSNAKSRTAAAEIWLERHLDDGTIPTDEPQDLPF